MADMVQAYDDLVCPHCGKAMRVASFEAGTQFLIRCEHCDQMIVGQVGHTPESLKRLEDRLRGAGAVPLIPMWPVI